ncbi:HTH-type transcriptional regulator LutR [Aquimixticola soesokkakensis]|uniref:HTH-type transcriptional regulator LutR n=1 Tax=Aquimixticola soesokkakensis TaxID=1519096 RepID=A0A1Y5RY71_9RHOB|nr:transcriptional regulator NanR [Aquimixticola soesokkakensis]SLN27140.1 HTH-type transcriptional regulator LutR [Aquimixticola soesokkakensis]
MSQIDPKAQSAAPTAPKEKIVRRKLADQVLDRLRDMIREGELKAGDFMPSERALMDRFGVGRPAVREALQSLHNSGLITINHGERSRVNDINPATVLSQSDDLARLVLSAAPANLGHLKHARQMFELGMVRVAAERASAEDIAQLRALVEDQRSKMGQAAVFVAADIAFHRKIAAICANPIISSVADAMLGWLFEYHVSLLHRSDSETVTLAEHARIVDLIEARDADAACDEMRHHLERSRGAFETH